ncbi:hypothetical protein PHYPO_G00162450 [Pangasianodon hypophthalmus]|uniref:Fibronectin type-III domain-containing protein n=2 Tax=Pangasianodon hypophthalmus TaxID=310915 RepID=A0A5N5JVC0_PANHP|nr:hypothetical protein PHYPO_G00162450 [Pangasianodon hypophthalmus]
MTEQEQKLQKIAWTYNHIDTMLRKHPAPPLLLSITLLISSILASSSSSPPHNATHHPGVPNPHFFSPGEDYNDYNEELTTETTHKTMGSPPPPCEYDSCKDQQESCQKLALTLSCSCPGISGPFELPDTPTLWRLSLEPSGMVVVRWCAPSSTVTHYLVQVEGQDEARDARENRRMMELGDIAPGTEVCVEAVNKAGVSTRTSSSCARFESSETTFTVKLVLVGAAVVLVVVIVSALLLWWCRRHRKTPTRTANRGTDMVL